jgi:hypothetical protein
VLANVHTLLLWGNRIGPSGLRHLLGSGHAGCLRTLYVNEDRLGERGAEWLASWPGLAQAETLSLWGNSFGPEGAAALAAASMPALSVLLLNNNRIGDPGAVALADSPSVARLTRLDLQVNAIGDRGGRALIESPHLPARLAINLRGNTFSDAVAEEARQRFGPDVVS